MLFSGLYVGDSFFMPTATRNGKPKLELRRIPIADVNPAPYNPRVDLKPGDEDYDLLAKGIDEFGLVEPLVFNDFNQRLISGHQRLKILAARGDTEVDVSVVNIPEEGREKALNIALNRIGGDWNRSALKDLLEELDCGAFDLDLTGFTDDALKELMSEFHVPDFIGSTETDRDGQGVSSPWGQVKLSGNIPVKIGEIESHLDNASYIRLRDILGDNYERLGSPFHNTLSVIITSGCNAFEHPGY